jgi:competence protein CoiA
MKHCSASQQPVPSEGAFMQRYANVDGQKQLPFPKGRGWCPCCGGLLIAKCGQINAHHWAHDKGDDCDTWSEPIGPWHLWWQGLVRPDFVEVV